ncbi:MAG: MBL fold metallo-hydrolase [Dehalococcoidia bacterium]|nr:MBL fold metallo-hydrolase [Dehalococcoidia bacterium]
MELFKGINQIKLPLPKVGQENVNVYIIEGIHGNLMVDTGWNTPEAFNTLAQEMKISGFAMKDITDVVITHIHPDHFGLAGKIADLTGAKIYLSDIDYNMVDSRYFHPENILNDMSSFMQVNGVPDWELKMLTEASQTIRDFISPVSDVNILKPGDHISMEPFDFQVILTPGHTPGHICLYETNKKYLFSGDQVLAEVVPNISYHTQSGENPLGDYVNSLNALRELEVRFVFPGHGSVFSGLIAKTDDIMRYHRDRMFSIQKVMGLETKNAYDIAKSLSWVIDGEAQAYDKLEPIDRRLAVLNVLAHLQYLVAENKGNKMDDGGRTVYWSGE